jgi:ketosteroid isomerase-like protein
MSQENVEVVRQQIAAQSRRRLEERLALRFPRASTLFVRAVQRLSPHSRLRRAAIRRAARLGFEALNRDDVEAALALYHPEVELILPPDYFGLGLDHVYRGLEERFRFEQRLIAEWGMLRYAFEEIIDLGDGRVVLLGRLKTGGLNGAPVDMEFAEIFTVSGGRVIREQAFVNNAEALEAAGLKE